MGLLAEMSQPIAQDIAAGPNPRSLLLVSEILAKYLDFAEVYYADGDKPDKEFRAMIDAVEDTS